MVFMKSFFQKKDFKPKKKRFKPPKKIVYKNKYESMNKSLEQRRDLEIGKEFNELSFFYCILLNIFYHHKF